ncbi:MAG: dihydroxyacetone kinase subunit L [Spirochaetaceae bacterium]|nr:MAG: dihydroxyacetone kinase subunit L [Spirochaetaceae bacterium]
MPLSLNTRDAVAILTKLAEVFEQNKDRLNELDARIGDGDHGLSMARGFAAAARQVEEKSPATIGSALMEGGMQFNEAAGSTIGILMFSAMREAGKAVKDKIEATLSDLAEMLEAAVQGIMKRGKAQVGQKTILDSLHPALEALRAGIAAGAEEQKLVAEALRAAADGAERTRDLLPEVGRARWFSERSKGQIDPGAVSGHLILKTIGDYLLEK